MQNKAFWEKHLKGLNIIMEILNISIRPAKFPDVTDEPFIKSSVLFDQQNKKDLENNEE